MLKSQYGVATSSSATPVSHAEDAQPNETIYKRRHGQPPQIGSTWKNSYRDSRGGHSGSWTQYGTRGNSSWRGRGNFQPNRGSHNPKRRCTSQEQRSAQHSVPPIATLPDLPSASNSLSLSSQTNSSSQPSMSDSDVNRLSQREPPYMVPPDVPVPSSPTFSQRQLVDDYHWLYRSKSPSPKLLPFTLKRRQIERQPTHVSNSRQNQHSPTAEFMSPETSKPVLPGRHRQPESSAPIPASQSLDPLVPLHMEVSAIVPNILTETSIKEEPHTPSPAQSLRMERSLITSSCKFYPIPENCKKSCLGYKESRMVFCKEKTQELSRLGLKTMKSIFRDDGLAIDWTSKVPVWSDTLLPDFPDLASAIKRAYQMNHATAMKPSPKRKRLNIDPHSKNSDLNTNMESYEFKRSRHSLEKAPIGDCADEIEIIEPPTIPSRISSSSKPLFSLDRGNYSLTAIVPLPDTSELISFDPEECDTVLGEPESFNTVSSVQKTPAMDVNTPLPTRLPKPARRMQFKPVFPLCRSQSTSSSAQDSTLLTSASASSTNLSVVKRLTKDDTQVNSQPDCLPRPLPGRRPRHFSRGPDQSHLLPTATQKASAQQVPKSHTPTSHAPLVPPPPRDTQVAEVEIREKKAFPSKDEDCGNTTDPDAELIVNLLLCETPDQSNNRLPDSCQEAIMEDVGHESEEDRNGKRLVSAEEDMAAIEKLATQFFQRYSQLFDVDRLGLEAAYAKNALFSCRVHHVQEPSFSMAGLFAPERQGFNVSRSRASISAIQNGRAQIVNRLLELGPHRFCPRGIPRTVNYDIVPLPPTIGGGILFTVHGQVVNPHLAGPQMDHVLSVDQSFVLRKRGLEDGDDSASNLWPLVAVSHQMTVREAVPFSLEQLGGFASRNQSN